MRTNVPGQPAYVTIAAYLREMIKKGELAPGAKLPTNKDLTRDWNVSAIVARQAIATLKTEGLIYGVKGKGVFVTERRQLVRVAPSRYSRGKPTRTYRAEAATARQKLEKTANTVQTQATEDIAERLGIEPGDAVSETTYFFRADGVPVTSSQAWEPLELTAGTAIEWPEQGPYAHLGVVDRFEQIGQVATEVQEELVIRMPEPSEAQHLEIPPGVPLVEVRQTFLSDERPLEIATIMFPADRYRFVYRMPIPDHER
ncbi:GntR family transcriptional regulator [Actinokineospora sp. NBRC 105648]|uniref:GntR family transcriptional regulator n=1 Tax=Actinokineospora sp. NBRC 105648 TaxID=3032206 RepID=UPI0024A0E87A|nr:GntR family transcriptional regulator [Actinokineospora sp. NBRC 105648]GLZ43716.1 GntR family transcriptional regulator [Actinokineospora sp. NBRC 105648]